MTAFEMKLDATAQLAGLLGVVFVIAAGMIPAFLRILNLPVARALKET